MCAPRSGRTRALSVGLLGNAAEVVPELPAEASNSTWSPTRPRRTTPERLRGGGLADRGGRKLGEPIPRVPGACPDSIATHVEAMLGTSAAGS